MSRIAGAVAEVMVRFKEAAVVFVLPEGATLADIARRIAGIEQRQFGAPVSIDVQLRH
jgi:hypothetical protein